MQESPNKSPEKGDTVAYAPALALLHVAELRRTRSQTWIIYYVIHLGEEGVFPLFQGIWHYIINEQPQAVFFKMGPH